MRTVSWGGYLLDRSGQRLHQRPFHLANDYVVTLISTAELAAGSASQHVRATGKQTSWPDLTTWGRGDRDNDACRRNSLHRHRMVLAGRASGAALKARRFPHDRAFAADACAHPADRIVVIGHSFGAEAAARVATQAAACGARDVTMIGIDPAAPSEVRGVSHAVNFVGEYRGTIGGAQNIPLPGYTHMSIMESPAV
jgi:hypothetical protein